MKLGIGSYTFPWAIGVGSQIPDRPLDLYQLVDRALSFGAQCLQIADNMPLDQLAHCELEMLHNYTFEKGIQLEVGMRGLQYEQVNHYIEIARVLRANLLRVVIDSKGYAPDIATIIQILKSVVPLLEAHRITLVIENHDRLAAKEFLKIIEGVNSTNVRICLDTVNSIGSGEGLESVINVLGAYTVNLHVKDYTIQRYEHMMGFEVKGAPAGKGMLNIPALLEQIAMNGISQSAILEVWTPPDANLKDTIAKELRWATESWKYLQSIHKQHIHASASQALKYLK